MLDVMLGAPILLLWNYSIHEYAPHAEAFATVKLEENSMNTYFTKLNVKQGSQQQWNMNGIQTGS